MGTEEQHNIVIVGGGICGLATALALHRKGFQTLVLEKSDSLRATGAAIGIFINGWRALDQLGVGNELRMKAIPIIEIQDALLNKNRMRVTSCRNEDYRCLKRSDLIEALAKGLPVNSIRFGCKIVAIEANLVASFPIIHIDDGSKIKAKVLIGCDGSNSVVAKSLRLKAPELFPALTVRGFTDYPDCHNYESCLFRLQGDEMLYGRIPLDNKLVYWYVCWRSPSQAHNYSEVEKTPQRIRNLALDLLKKFPSDVTEMVQHCDLDSLSLTHTRYRSPWCLLSEKLWEGTMTVAGDAMHVMGPFLAQGGSAGLEDAIVLARCLARELEIGTDCEISDRDLKKRVGIAFSQYVKERRSRLLRLSIQTYLTGSLRLNSSWVKKMIYLTILLVFFGGMSLSHTKYDCGRL